MGRHQEIRHQVIQGVPVEALSQGVQAQEVPAQEVPAQRVQAQGVPAQEVLTLMVDIQVEEAVILPHHPKVEVSHYLRLSTILIRGRVMLMRIILSQVLKEKAPTILKGL